ncbi:AMP-binding protein [Lacisediminihabitans sp. FW035]
MPLTSQPLDSANDSPLTPLRFLKRSAEVFPAKTAIVYGARTYTYAQFATAAEALARAIRSRIIPGDRVVFLSPNTPEMLIAQFAVPLAGGVLISLNPRLAPAEVRYVLEHSEASLLFFDAEFASAVGDSLRVCPALRAIVEIPDAEFGCAESVVNIGQESYLAFGSATAPDSTPVRWEIDDERAVISINYTSGTTGKPKGVMYSHRGAYLNAMGEVFHNGLDNKSVYLWTLPLFHCNGWCTPWAVTAASGTHVCLRAVRPASVWAAIDRLGVTNLCGAPTVCSVIADSDDAHPLERPLRITTAGAPPSPTIIERLERLGATVVHVYGLTEAYGPFTICEYQESWDELAPAARATMIARQGVSMVQAEAPRVVDAGMGDVPRDGTTIGEIVLRGNNVMIGYYRDADATAAAFAGGWFHTGDLGVMHPDGYVEVKDRAKDIIISGGENISSIEVENSIASHPSVADVAVVGFAHETWGERPEAYVLLHEGHFATAEEISTHARLTLARFKVPDSVVFVDALPRTATGKIVKALLRARSTRPDPVSTH